MHAGMKSQLEVDDVEKGLLAWIFEQRQQGLAVSDVSVVIKAASLSRKFKQKSFTDNTLQRLGSLRNMG
jgi:hypothetical protein